MFVRFVWSFAKVFISSFWINFAYFLKKEVTKSFPARKIWKKKETETRDLLYYTVHWKLSDCVYFSENNIHRKKIFSIKFSSTSFFQFFTRKILKVLPIILTFFLFVRKVYTVGILRNRHLSKSTLTFFRCLQTSFLIHL